MNGKRVFFEIQTFADDRWTTVELRETEAMAMTVARGLLANPRSRGVQVVRSWKRADGLADETVIFVEKRETPAAEVTVVPITDAYLCTDIYDFYGLPSRMTINRLFRKYIDVAFLTPTELLHNHRALQKIQAFGTLFSAGVDRVSSLQGSMPGQTSKARRDALYAITDKIALRGRKLADHPKLPLLDGNDLAGVLDAVVGVASPGREAYAALVVLCNELVKERSWLGKFDRLARLAGGDPRPDVLAVIDGLVADLVGIASAFQDIMGYQRNLAETLCAIADLCEGKFSGDKSDGREPLAVFVPLLAAGRMPETRLALIDRLVRQLMGTQPLDRHDPSREKAAFRAVSARLAGKDGVFGGAGVEAGLRKRELALFGPGGAPPPEVEARQPALDPRQRAATLAALASDGSKVQDYPAGSLIFREGEAADRAYMVLAGSVEISTEYKGAHVMLARLAEGAIFGELALFSTMPRTASAVSVTGCRLRLIESGEMEQRVEALDPFCRHWVSYLIDRITDLSERVTATAAGEAR